MPLLLLFCLYLNFNLFNCDEQPKFEDTSDIPMEPSYKYDSDTERRFEEIKQKLQKDFSNRKANIPPNFDIGILDYDITPIDFFGTTARTELNELKKDRPIWAPTRRATTQKIPQFGDGGLMRMSVPTPPDKSTDKPITTAEPGLNNNRPLWTPKRNVKRQKDFQGFRRQLDDGDLMHITALTSPDMEPTNAQLTTTAIVLNNEHPVWAPKRSFGSPKIPQLNDDDLIHVSIPASLEMKATDYNATTVGTAIDNDLTRPSNSREKTPKHTFKQLIEMKRRRRLADHLRRELDNGNAIIPENNPLLFKEIHPYYDYNKNIITKTKNQEKNAIIPRKDQRLFKKAIHPYYDNENVITNTKNPNEMNETSFQIAKSSRDPLQPILFDNLEARVLEAI